MVPENANSQSATRIVYRGLFTPAFAGRKYFIHQLVALHFLIRRKPKSIFSNRSWRLLVAIQFAHECYQVYRNGGASGIGELSPQSNPKRLHEFHQVERGRGQTAHVSPPASQWFEYDRGDFVPPRKFFCGDEA